MRDVLATSKFLLRAYVGVRLYCWKFNLELSQFLSSLRLDLVCTRYEVLVFANRKADLFLLFLMFIHLVQNYTFHPIFVQVKFIKQRLDLCRLKIAIFNFPRLEHTVVLLLVEL